MSRNGAATSSACIKTLSKEAKFRGTSGSLLENWEGRGFWGKARIARRNEEDASRTGQYPQRSVTKQQRSKTGFSASPLWAAVLLPKARVGSAITARCGDLPAGRQVRRPRRLGPGQNPSPQHSSQFSGRLRVKDMPKSKHHDLDFIVDQLDWDKNADPHFKSKCRRTVDKLEPVPVAPTRAAN